MKEYLQPPRGMRDIIGREAELYEYLIGEFKRIARLHGYKPVIPPTVEFYKLFEAKSGEEIKRSMYVFKDKAGRVLALRPEVTASITRIYIRKLRGEVKPIKLYYVTQCFRYEEPQHGRYREFWQLGLEVIGDQSIVADVETAYTASHFLEEVGIKHYYIVNNISIYRTFMDLYGVDQNTQDYILHLIDKREIDKALNIFKSLNPELYELFSKLLVSDLKELEYIIDEYKGVLREKYDFILNEYSKLRKFIELLNNMGYTAKYEPLLVRGLAYYTGLIYEYKAVNNKLKISFGGGGRYDGLTTVYGAPYEYSTGLALGLDRIALLIDNVMDRISRSVDVLIVLREEVPLKYGFNIVKSLNEHGISTWIIVTDRIGKALSIADRRGIGYAIIIGGREYSENKATIKDLENGEQVSLELNKLISYFIERIFKTYNIKSP